MRESETAPEEETDRFEGCFVLLILRGAKLLLVLECFGFVSRRRFTSPTHFSESTPNLKTYLDQLGLRLSIVELAIVDAYRQRFSITCL